MATILEIALKQELPHYSQRTEIYGLTYVFEFQWIERGKFWLLHIFDNADNPLAVGIKLVEDWPLLRRELFFPFALMFSSGSLLVFNVV